VLLVVGGTVFGGFGDVAVHDGSTVQDYLDFVALENYLLVVPFPYRFEVPSGPWQLHAEGYTSGRYTEH